MTDPFTAGHREAARKADAAAEKLRQEAVVERATAKGAAAGKPKPPERPFVPSRPFWAPGNE